jgi:hypothetical protein
MQDNNNVLNIIQKEYLKAGNSKINNMNKDEINMNPNVNLNIKNNISHINCFNEEINDNNKNIHEISNMLSNILFEKNNDVKNNNLDNNKNNNIQQNTLNNNK